MFRRLKKGNHGFSLIELIVCILMLSMVMGIIGLFVGTSTKSYNLVYEDANMQTEADIAMTYINDIAVEAKDYKAVSSYMHGSINCSALCMEAPDADNPADPYSYYIIWRQDDDNKLRFCKLAKSGLKSVKADGSIASAADIDIDATLTQAGVYSNPENFLAQYVTGFSAVVPEDTAFPVLQVTVRLKYGDSNFVSTKSIASRNIY